MTKKKENTLELVEVRVSPTWITFISYCLEKAPYGMVKVKLNAGEPVRILERWEGETRLDEPQAIKNVLELLKKK
jgi:hypothetical protein